MVDGWNAFCLATEALLGSSGIGKLLLDQNFVSHVRNLHSRGLESLMVEHLLCSVEETFEKNGASKFWRHFDFYSNPAVLEMDDADQEEEIHDVLHKALEEILSLKQDQENCLLMLVHALDMCMESKSKERVCSGADQNLLLSKYQLMVSSVLMASLPRHFPVGAAIWRSKCAITPLHASIITQFQDQTSWTSKNLAAAVGVPVDILNRRICFWVNKVSFVRYPTSLGVKILSQYIRES